MYGFSTLLMLWAAYVADTAKAAERLKRCKWWASGRTVYVIPNQSGGDRPSSYP